MTAETYESLDVLSVSVHIDYVNISELFLYPIHELVLSTILLSGQILDQTYIPPNKKRRITSPPLKRVH